MSREGQDQDQRTGLYEEYFREPSTPADCWTISALQFYIDHRGEYHYY